MDSPQPYSLLTLANNTCFRHTLTDIRERFNKLYRRKVSTWCECEGVWCEVCVRDGSVRNGSVRHVSMVYEGCSAADRGRQPGQFAPGCQFGV